MLITPRLYYRPFKYPEAHEFFLKQQQAHWLWTEVNMGPDIKDYNENLTEDEKKVVIRILRLFTTIEIDAEDYWSSNVAKWFKHPEVQQMAATNGAFESIHIAAYDHLSISLGLPLSEYKEFLKNPAMKAKKEKLSAILNDTETLEGKARSLAVFSGFTEGVSLFSSFAVLMNFSRFNKLKGVANIVSWSVRDECFVEGTEILTENGFVDFKDLQPNMKVAQFNPETKQISFVISERYVENYVDEDVVYFDSGKMPIRLGVTKNHEILQRWDYQPKYTKQTAEKFNPNPKKRMPVAGYSTGSKDSLTFVERFLIAVQADGSVSDRYTGEKCGTVPVTFSFAKERKIERLRWILNNLGWSFSENFEEQKGNRSAQTKIRVNVPVDIVPHKTLCWIDFENISSKWAAEFLEELVLWDGWTPDAEDVHYLYYSSTIKMNCDMVQAVAALCGKWVTMGVQKDDRSDTFSDVYRCYIHDLDEKGVGGLNKTVERYQGMVRCVTVPTGAIVVRYKNSVSIVGNCMHSDAGTWLFRTLMSEHPEIWTDEFKKTIYQAARDIIDLEDDYIDAVFENAEIQGINPKQLKAYIRYRANTKLQDLGLKTNWKNIDTESVKAITSWFDVLSSGNEHSDFFALKSTAYSKGHVDWSKIKF